MTSGPEDVPAPPSRQVEAWASAGVMLLVGVLLWMRLSSPTPATYTMWSDRDLARGITFWQTLPDGGAELGGGAGARVPGGLYALLTWAGWTLTQDVERLMVLLLAAEAAGAVLLAIAAWRLAGPVAAAGALVYATASMGARTPMTALWNPMWVPPLVALTVVGTLAGVRGWRLGWWLAGAALAVGVQVHASMGVWLLGVLVFPFLVAPRTALQGALTVVAWAVVAQLPFLVLDLARGGTNLVLLGEQQAVRDLGEGALVGLDLGKLADAVSRLVPWLGTQGPAAGVTAAIGWGVLCLGLLGWGRALVGPNARFGGARVIGAVALVLLLTPALLNASLVEDRYLLPAVTAWALGVGLGASWVAERGRMPALATLLGLAALPGSEILARWWTPDVANAGTWAWQTEAIRRLEDTTQQSLGEVASRTSWLVRGPLEGTWALAPEQPVHARLAMVGEAFEGGGAPPCFAVAPRQEALPANPSAALSLALARLGDDVQVLATQPLTDELILLTYDLNAEACPTTMSAPYVRVPTDPPEFAVVRPAEVDEATALGEGVWLVRLAGGEHDGVAYDPVDFTLQVVPGPRTLRTTLSSRQLRGLTHNDGGPLAAAWLPRMMLRLSNPYGEYTVELVRNGVGRNGVATPWTRTPHAHHGTHQVVLETWVAARGTEPGSDPRARVSRVALGQVVVPPR